MILQSWPCFLKSANCIGWWFQEERWALGIPLQVPTTSSFHWCVEDRLGCSSSRSHGSRSLVLGEEGPSHKYSRDEGSLVLLECLPSQDSRRVGHSHEQGGTVARVMCSLVQEIMTWTELHLVTSWGRRTSWWTSLAIQIRCFLQSGPSFPGCSMPSLRYSVVSCGLVCYQSKGKAPFVCVFCSWSDGMETWCVSASLEWFQCLCISPLYSSKTGLVESDAFDILFLVPGRSCLASKGVVCRSAGPYGGRSNFLCCGILWSSHPLGNFTEVWKRCDFTCGSCQVTSHEGWFSKEAAEVVISYLRRSTACIYHGKWLGFLHLCRGRNISTCRATVLQMVEFFMYLQKELKLLVPAFKG